MTLDYRKIVKYPPEIFVEATPINLTAGTNALFSYLNINYRPKYILTLTGISFDNSVNGRFSLKVDDIEGVMKIDDITSTKGIQYNEEVRIPASENMIGTVYVAADVPNFKSRHLLRVENPTTILKLFYGFELTDRDRELMSKFNIDPSSITAVEMNPYRDNIRKVITTGKSLSSSGTVFRINVPKDHKIVLLDIAADTPANPNEVLISVERDAVDTLLLDAYCLQGLNPIWNGSRYTNSLRIVALDELTITASVATGTPKFRITYAIGKLTLEEKIRWNVELTPSERKEAEEKDLYDKVEAGIV